MFCVLKVKIQPTIMFGNERKLVVKKRKVLMVETKLRMKNRRKRNNSLIRKFRQIQLKAFRFSLKNVCFLASFLILT